MYATLHHTNYCVHAVLSDGRTASFPIGEVADKAALERAYKAAEQYLGQIGFVDREYLGGPEL